MKDAPKSDKYEVEAEIGRGGMGLILRVKDREIQRNVAMKVMLAGADPNAQTRFIEEGRITGRLEHPNIVPVHEVGVDQDGRRYFTMKLVDGRSLADALKSMRGTNVRDLLKLPHLLNVFISVCHAVSFAHSRGILHRDLKPANVMLGEFGEVLVMDWGLAKDRQARGAAAVGDMFGSGLTVEGMAMGTPAYMSPEQAKGELAKIDERSDIYSLGAMLYEILTLTPPVEGGNVISVLGKVVDGDIQAPEVRTPGRKIPGELSAIAMKALAAEPAQRYQTVTALIADVQLFLEGRAVSAKDDSALETVLKLFQRRRTESIAALLVLLVLTGAVATGYWMNADARARAEQAKQAAEDARVSAEKNLAAYVEAQKQRLADQLKAAPAFLGRAENAVQARNFDAALQDLDVALSYDPTLAAALLLKAQVLLYQKNYSAGSEALTEYLHMQPGDIDAVELRSICEQAKSGESLAIASKIADVFVRQQQYTLAEGPGISAEHLFEAYRRRIERAWPGFGNNLQRDKDGKLSFDIFKNIKSKQIYDLEPLRNIPLSCLFVQKTNIRGIESLTGMPLQRLRIDETAVASLEPLRNMKLETLNLAHCHELSDLSPLKGMPLTFLNLHGSGVHNIEALAGMPLNELAIDYTAVADLSPLAGMKLVRFFAQRAAVGDISVLNGMPLEMLNLSLTKVADLTPLHAAQLKTFWVRDSPNVENISVLKGMPLEELDLSGTRVSDLSALQGMSLKLFTFTPRNITRGLEIVRGMDSLKEIGAVTDHRMPTAEFWKRFDAGEFRK